MKDDGLHELIRGRWYRYDPDFDIWVAVPVQESFASRWAWLALVIILAAICLIL